MKTRRYTFTDIQITSKHVRTSKAQDLHIYHVYN